jgi:hypothetical protein
MEASVMNIVTLAQVWEQKVNWLKNHILEELSRKKMKVFLSL